MSEQPVVATGVPEWDVADRMRKALRTSNVGVQEIADYLGVGRNTVSNWINGRIRPSKQTLRLWALRTATPLEWLEDGDAPTAGGGGGGETLPRMDSNHQPAGWQSSQVRGYIRDLAIVLPLHPIDEPRSPERHRTTRRGPRRTFSPILCLTDHKAS